MIGSSSSAGAAAASSGSRATSKSASNIATGSSPHQPEWKDNSGQWNRKGSRYRNRTISSMPTIGEQRLANHIRKGSAKDTATRSRSINNNNNNNNNNGGGGGGEEEVVAMASSAPASTGDDSGPGTKGR